MNYEPTPDVLARLNNDFAYHPASGDQPKRYEEIRAQALALAELLARSCPPGRELSSALTKIEEGVMWAIAAIARNESPAEPPGPLSTEQAAALLLQSYRDYDGSHDSSLLAAEQALVAAGWTEAMANDLIDTFEAMLHDDGLPSSAITSAALAAAYDADAEEPPPCPTS